jgi:hypothetical protein
MFFYFVRPPSTHPQIITGGSQKDAEYKLAQSGDATCNGLESAEVSF